MNTASQRYKWFVLISLTLVYTFSFLDRQIMIILQEEIKVDLLLNDTQLGLLTGLAFAVLYTTLGIPIAKYADSHNRKNIVTFSLTFWSAMTVLSGLAQNFLQMLLTRIGVSAGEAGGIPPSHSIISDYFPIKQRATAFSIYSAGLYLGILLGFILAGGIASAFGWRVAFYSLGIPGIVFAIFLHFTVKEPERGRLDPVKKEQQNYSFIEVFRYLFKQKSFMFTCLGAGFTTFALYSINNFLPSYLIRFHQIDLVTASVVLGLTSGVGGIVGTFIGGRIADKRGESNKKWYLYVPIMACLMTIIPAVIILYSGNQYLSLGMAFPMILISATFFGPVYAVVQSLAKANMRAIATAIILLFMNGIGLAFGPLIVGILSDYLAPNYGVLSLRYAISINLLSMFLAAFMYWLASKHYEVDLEKLGQ